MIKKMFGECEYAAAAAASTISRYLHQQRFVHFQRPAAIDQQPQQRNGIENPENPRQEHPPTQQEQQIRSGKLLFLVSLLNRIANSPVSAHGDQDPDPGSSCAKNERQIIPDWICRRLTFYRLHWAYFISVAFLASICFWSFPKPPSAEIPRLSYIDSLYSAVSVTCTTGLISVRMQDFSVPDTILMMFLMILGSPIFTSVLPLYFRQYQFRKNIRELEHHLHLCKCAVVSFSDRAGEVESDAESDLAPPGLCGLHKRVAAAAVEAASDAASDATSDRDSEPVLRAALAATRLEYEAIVALNWVVSGYILACVGVGFFILEMLFQASDRARGILHANNVDPSYFAIFQTVSAFTNSGVLLLNDNMVPLREFNGVLLWSSVLILIGNTMFAPCLRAVVGVLWRFSSGRAAAVYEYLLKNPRRCFTHLFPKNQTIWLVVTVMGFNAFESAFFYILSWKSDSLKGLNVPQKIVNGIFQSVTTRSAGENVVSINGLSPSMLVLYIAMMYIAVYPVYLSRQNSQAEDQPIEEVIMKKKPKLKKNKKKRGDFTIATQSKRLIARDSAFLFISIFVLCIIENRRIDDDPLNFSIFNIIFEVISAYGNVGLSMGYSCAYLKKVVSNENNNSCVDVPYSFSGKWSLSGKLLMIVIMFLGRHRGLPDNMDSALQIPKSFFSVDNQQKLQQQNQEQQTEFIVEIPAVELVELETPPADQPSDLEADPVSRTTNGSVDEYDLSKR